MPNKRTALAIRLEIQNYRQFLNSLNQRNVWFGKPVRNLNYQTFM